MKPKDSLPMLQQTGVIYNIPCNDYNIEYKGETGRVLSTWKKEHERSVRLAKTENSALAKHVHDKDYLVAWDNAKILCKES